MAEILKHEQGTTTLPTWNSRKCCALGEPHPLYGQLQNEAMDIFNRIDAKYKQLNIDYDEDTEHSTNKQQQHSWDIYFAKRIENMPPLNCS
jgi:hypothetical protein